jgi:hypothetical protein
MTRKSNIISDKDWEGYTSYGLFGMYVTFVLSHVQEGPIKIYKREHENQRDSLQEYIEFIRVKIMPIDGHFPIVSSSMLAVGTWPV